MAHLRGGIRTAGPSKKRYRSNSDDMDSTHGPSTVGSANVGNTERFLSAITGVGLLVRGIKGGAGIVGPVRALMGIGLLFRAATGYCPAYGAVGVNTRDRSDTSSPGRRKIRSDRAVKVEQSIIIERAPADLYRFWRRLENLPKVMTHLRSVEAINDYQSHWVVNTLPGVATIEWDAEIINEVENERIGWKTLPDSLVEHAGSVVFEALNKNSTIVTVTMQYDPPGGAAGAALAALFGQDPAKTIGDDLLHFKQAMESDTAPVAPKVS